MILDIIDKENLHHAYLIESGYEEIRDEILLFLEGFKDRELIEIKTDAFKIEDARNLKFLGSEKSYVAGKKIFVISANSILREAQNAMLKLFEEPIPDTHFFVIVPDINSLLKTLVSRFYVITPRQGLGVEQEVLEFLKMPVARRLDYIKNKLAKFEDEETITDSARADALRFLNSLESTLHQKMPRGTLDIECFEQIFKVREMLRMPGSSIKNLLESVALIVPVIQ